MVLGEGLGISSGFRLAYQQGAEVTLSGQRPEVRARPPLLTPMDGVPTK